MNQSRFPAPTCCAGGQSSPLPTQTPPSNSSDASAFFFRHRDLQNQTFQPGNGAARSRAPPQEVQPRGPVNASRSKNKKGKTFPKPAKHPNTPTLTTDKRAEADGSPTRRPIEDWPLADISSIIAAKFITVTRVSGSGMDGRDIFLTSPAGWVVMDG